MKSPFGDFFFLGDAMTADAFSNCHPAVNFLFFVGAIGFSVLIQHPAYLIAGAIGAAAYYLLLVMVLRMIPSFIRKAGQIMGARKSIGLGAGENSTMKEKLTSGMRTLSALTDWTLEGSIVTGDSMRARGYGTAKRTSFQIYRMKALDWTLLAVMLTLAGVAAVAAAMGGAAAEFTPKLAIQPVTGIYAPGFIAYCAYLFIPSALHMKEAVQWHISRSRI